MEIYPMQKQIIIYGVHLDQIRYHTTEENLMKILKEKSFVVTNDLSELGIVVYKSSHFSDHSKRTYIVTDFGNEITEIKYYTSKE